jgi:AcrR family transcriptional regulator
MFSIEPASSSSPGSKPAIQPRARETRDKLIAALDELLREQDFETVTVAEIAARAGVSAASIYQRFGNRHAAVSILISLYVRRLTQWWGITPGDPPRADTSPSLREAMVLLARRACRLCDELGYVMRPAYLQSRLHPELLGEHWRAQEEQAVRRFHALLRSHAGEIDHPDLTRAAGMIAYLFNMMILGRLLHPGGLSTWDVPTDEQEFAEELADFACGYLGVADASSPRPPKAPATGRGERR